MIKAETHLSKDIDLIGYNDKLDELCKRILSNKIILAWIMKSCMAEYHDYEISDIVLCYIEGTPQVAKMIIHQDERKSDEQAFGERITGANTEDSTVTEGKVTYDIRFIAIHPSIKEPRHMIINIEAQDDFYPGYPIIKRGIYHCSRLISSQHGTEFSHSHYEDIKKVYSVWICTNPPNYRKNTITKYSISERGIVGKVKEKTENYDLLTAIMICLGGSGYKNYYGILKLLDVIFSTEISVQEKKWILQSEFHIEMTREIEKEVQDMCDFSAGVERRGIEKGKRIGKKIGEKRGEKRGEKKGIVKSIKNLMNTMDLTMEQAMDALLIPKDKRKEYMNLL